MFNPDDLKNFTTTEKGSTVIVPVPEGEWPAIIGERLEFRQAPATKDPNRILTFMDLDMLIDSAEVRDFTKRERPTVRWGCILDLTADGRGLDMSEGKNIQLNRLRTAVGQNVPGQPWAPTMLAGKPVKVKVEHSPNPNDPETPYANATAVTALD